MKLPILLLNNVVTICLALELTCIAPTSFFMFSSCESLELPRWDSETCSGFKSDTVQYRPWSADTEWLCSDCQSCCLFCFWVNETNHMQVPINNLISLSFWKLWAYKATPSVNFSQNFYIVYIINYPHPASEQWEVTEKVKVIKQKPVSGC